MIWRWALYSVHDLTGNYYIYRIGCLMNHQKAYKQNGNLDHRATLLRELKLFAYCIIQHLSICNWVESFKSSSSSSSSSNFIPNRIQQYNRVCMTNITNNRVIIDIVMWFCWWPPGKPWAYQAGSHKIQDESYANKRHCFLWAVCLLGKSEVRRFNYFHNKIYHQLVGEVEGLSVKSHLNFFLSFWQVMHISTGHVRRYVHTDIYQTHITFMN